MEWLEAGDDDSWGDGDSCDDAEQAEWLPCAINENREWKSLGRDDSAEIPRDRAAAATARSNVNGPSSSARAVHFSDESEAFGERRRLNRVSGVYSAASWVPRHPCTRSGVWKEITDPRLPTLGSSCRPAAESGAQCLQAPPPPQQLPQRAASEAVALWLNALETNSATYEPDSKKSLSQGRPPTGARGLQGTSPSLLMLGWGSWALPGPREPTPAFFLDMPPRAAPLS